LVQVSVRELVHLDRGARTVPPPHAEERSDAPGEVEDLHGLGLRLAHRRADRIGIERAENAFDDR
jgi:hypothetical protein